MLTFEIEIGRGVIKRIAIQTDDIRIATSVIGVALLACQCRLLIELAVKTTFIGNIGSDDIVTFDAELILRLLGKRRVALIAIAFQFGVPLNQLSRH